VIVTVTLNPALDITYTVPNLEPGATHRPAVFAQAGGKGVNVARTLHALGRDVVALLPLGGSDGAVVREELVASGIPQAVVPIAGATRRTVTVVESGPHGVATGFNEAGPELSAAEWAAVVDLVAALVSDASVLVLSGKLPGGVPPEAYAELITVAKSWELPVILDTEGPALLAGLAAGPTLVKPNAHELAEVTGLDDPGQAAEVLLAGGAQAVVASFGPEGLAAFTADGAWQATPPTVAGGNPTGAGDAAVAALAMGLAEGTPWPEVLRDAAALSAATVLTDRAGAFDAEAYRRFREKVVVTSLL
jgi:tagatose 6-phosphate kinase